jgi:hypothetical protein
MRTTILSAAGLSSIALATPAFAQDGWSDDPPAQEAPDAAETESVTSGAPSGGLTSSGFPEPPPPPAPTDARPRRVHASHSRFRGGVSALFGSYWVDGRGVGALGLQGRLGAQVTDVFGVYATPGLYSMPDYANDALTRLSLGAVFDATIAHRFYVGGGPELFRTFHASSRGPVVDDQRVFALRFRTGVAFGTVRPARRHAFTLGFDSTLDFYDGTLGIAPSLSLGYDAF